MPTPIWTPGAPGGTVSTDEFNQFLVAHADSPVYQGQMMNLITERSGLSTLGGWLPLTGKNGAAVAPVFTATSPGFDHIRIPISLTGYTSPNEGVVFFQNEGFFPQDFEQAPDVTFSILTYSTSGPSSGTLVASVTISAQEINAICGGSWPEGQPALMEEPVQNAQASGLQPFQFYGFQAIEAGNWCVVYNGYNSSAATVPNVYVASVSGSTIGPWVTGTSMPFTPYAIAGATMLYAPNAGQLVLVGGETASNTYTNAVYTASFDQTGTMGSWQQQGNSPLPTSGVCNGAAVVSLNGQDYICVFLMTGTGQSVITTGMYWATIDSSGAVGTWNIAPNMQLPTNSATASPIRLAQQCLAIGPTCYVAYCADMVGATTPVIAQFTMTANGPTPWQLTYMDSSLATYFPSSVLLPGCMYQSPGGFTVSWEPSGSNPRPIHIGLSSQGLPTPWYAWGLDYQFGLTYYVQCAATTVSFPNADGSYFAFALATTSFIGNGASWYVDPMTWVTVPFPGLSLTPTNKYFLVISVPGSTNVGMGINIAYNSQMNTDTNGLVWLDLNGTGWVGDGFGTLGPYIIQFNGNPASGVTLVGSRAFPLCFFDDSGARIDKFWYDPNGVLLDWVEMAGSNRSVGILEYDSAGNLAALNQLG